MIISVIFHGFILCVIIWSCPKFISILHKWYKSYFQNPSNYFCTNDTKSSLFFFLVTLEHHSPILNAPLHQNKMVMMDANINTYEIYSYITRLIIGSKNDYGWGVLYNCLNQKSSSYTYTSKPVSVWTPSWYSPCKCFS